MAMAANVCVVGWVIVRAAPHCGQMIPCLGAAWACHPKVLGLMSWADLLPGQCSPYGGNPGSWWGLEQLAAEVHSEVSGSQEQLSAPWAFSASILFFKCPRRGTE